MLKIQIQLWICYTVNSNSIRLQSTSIKCNSIANLTANSCRPFQYGVNKETKLAERIVRRENWKKIELSSGDSKANLQIAVSPKIWTNSQLYTVDFL